MIDTAETTEKTGTVTAGLGLVGYNDPNAPVEVKAGQDAFDELARIAIEQETAAATSPNGKQAQAEAEAFHYEPQPVNLLVGWRFCTWKQRHVMALYESGALSNSYDNRFRRNFEVVKAAIEAGCFEAPLSIAIDMVLDLPVQDVEQLHDAIAANYMNTVLTPKN
jgi:hypothetical protein